MIGTHSIKTQNPLELNGKYKHGSWSGMLFNKQAWLTVKIQSILCQQVL